jgi:hypothetical protein
VITAEEIEASKLIDAHYGSLAVAAMATDPATLSLSTAKKAEFKELCVVVALFEESGFGSRYDGRGMHLLVADISVH